MKICTICKDSKNLEEFHKNKKRKDGYNNVCKKCRKSYHAEWYLDNKKIVLEHNKKNKNRTKEFLLNYLLNSKCVDCGEDDPVVLEFDHQSDKLFNISHGVRDRLSIERIKNEISKCEVVCSNCHKRRTAKTQGWFKDLSNKIS